MSRFIDRSYKDAVKAMHSLEGDGFAAMLAGGSVRDRLMGVPPKDYDVATDATPEQVMAHFKAQGLKVVPTGLEYGTVTVVFPGGPIELTTLRRDIDTDGRHAVVQFGKSFEEDAARRDFTINAMFEDKGGKIYDFHGGQKHIKEAKLVFVGDPAQRIREDYLRIMRLFRFMARLGFSTPPETLAAIADGKDGLRRVSIERVTSELWQLLGAVSPLKALRDMESTGILELILPELKSFAAKLPDETVLKTTALIKDNWRSTAAMAALLQLQSEANRPRVSEVTALGTRLRLSNQETKRLVFVAESATRLGTIGSESADALELVDQAEEAGGKGGFTGLYHPLLAALFRAEQAPQDKALREKLEHVRRVEERQGHLRTAELPLKGHEVMVITGLGPGPQLGQLMKDMRRAFRNGAWSTKPEGERWLAQRAGKTA